MKSMQTVRIRGTGAGIQGDQTEVQPFPLRDPVERAESAALYGSAVPDLFRRVPKEH